ncbi:TIGR03086 family protein [Streptomyces tateyamensis]|uniref:TIGR03086 family protein n=1 Tax=Streptomyces tateyamensis TaxID=565073 RepID=A0A2V4NLK2_9ACTN|nr:TIGR03086 family metal-binding protein [Streptomyces tateyamensis]PYC76115.1 TIGR03086 family protein [Streptomyces tateyamensis]
MTTTLASRHSTALALIAPVVAGIGREQLDLPTPCTGWDLRRLLSHLIGQQYGFAAAARGHGDRPGVFADHPLIDSPTVAFTALAAFADSARELVDAFAAAELSDRAVALPEILPGHPFPPAQAIAFHLLDTVVHGWDLAAALGQPFHCPDDLGEVVLQVARAVPVDPAFRAPGRAFAPARTLVELLPPLDRALLLLGRDPYWLA